jgi:hypothetical protein
MTDLTILAVQARPTMLRRVLARPRISLVTAHPDAEVARLTRQLVDVLPIDGRASFERTLGELSRIADHAPPSATTPRTLDLIGHATSDGLLRLGDWLIDGESPKVSAFFRGIADVELLPRLGVTSMRVLGCSTAVGARARRTLRILAELLDLEVLGTLGPIYSLHYDAEGFGEQWRFLLSRASEVPSSPVILPSPDAPAADHTATLALLRILDIESLPRVPLVAPPGSPPRHVVTNAAARELLSLVDRTRGAQMPGLLAIPSHELALLADNTSCHVAEVILDGHFLRVFPEGSHKAGVVYPVSDARHLLALVSALPSI